MRIKLSDIEAILLEMLRQAELDMQVQDDDLLIALLLTT
jgi:hypothetical protein